MSSLFQMALSFTFIASRNTSGAQVQAVLSNLKFGALDSHEGIQVHTLKDGRRKFFIHYNTQTSTVLRDRLYEFKRRKEAGEENVRPVRIVYGIHNGRDQWWDIYLCRTLNERDHDSLLERW